MTQASKRLRILAWPAAAILIAGGIFAAKSHSSTRSAAASSAASDDDIPIAQVQHGDLTIQVHATGELRASHAQMLTAPAVGGGALQITKLLPTSASVKKGDVVIEFDPTEQHYKLEQSRSELLQAEQEITKANADAAVLAAQDKVSILKDRYAVRQAELDVQKNEIVSSIDGKKNDLTLQQAQRVQAELQKDMQSHKESGQASIYLAKEKYNKAKLEMDQAQQNIDKMQVTAPMDGLVSIQKNRTGDFFFSGMSVPDFHSGDQARPGSAIAQIVDPQGLELVASLGEQNAGNIKLGQPVQVTFDAVPGHIFNATVKNIAGMSSGNIFEGDSGGSFEVTIQLATPASILHSGFTAQLLFVGQQKKNVLYLPRQAVFMKDGKRIVYVKQGSNYDPRPIKVQGESESRIVTDSFAAGTQIALVDPTAPRKPGVTPAASTGTP